MKRLFISLFLFFWSVFMFSACGRESETESNLRDYFIIETSENMLPTPEVASDWRLLGTHFLNDEVIQIWGQNIRNEQLQGFWDVYVYREDGTSEFKFGGIRNYYRDGWYMDEDGCFYIAMGNELVRLDNEGKEVFNCTYDRTFKTMFQDKKGNWMVLGETEGGTLTVSCPDEETGKLKDVDSIVIGDRETIHYLAGQADGIYMLDKQGVWKLNPENDAKETVMSFRKSAYTLETMPENFRVTEDGVVELLQSGKKIILTQVNIADTRKILTMCGAIDYPEIKEALNRFNQENDTYYVVWDTPEDLGMISAFKEQVGVEFATGGGPDLFFLTGVIDSDNLLDYVRKGAFVELNSYMEQSGVTEENYFPLTFSGLTDGESIYGITLFAVFSGDWVSTEVLGSNVSPTMEEFVDALLAYEEKAVLNGMRAENLPNMLFRTSVSMHGAVDWEAGTCDFENELFKKILQVCKRYGNDKRSDYPELTGSIIGHLYFIPTPEEYSAQGRIPVWGFFDEGNHPVVENLYTVAINSNSPYQDGAWAVLEYLLNGGIQYDSYSLLPVKRSSFEEFLSKEMEEGSLVYRMGPDGVHSYIVAKAGLDGYESYSAAMRDCENYRAMNDITEEKAEMIRYLMETAQTEPVRQQEILNIVLEEAAAYFANAKSLDEVCRLIQNRAQLYLDEKK